MSDLETYNCVVIDDEFLARKLISDYISRVPQLRLLGAFDSPVKAMNTIQGGSVHIIFIDIEMPDVSGIDFVRNMPFRPLVVFVTAYAEYAVQGFELDAIEYLLKPVTFPRFLKAANKAIAILGFKRKLEEYDRPHHQPDAGVTDKSEPKDFIIIRTERKIVKLMYDEIFFIEGALEYVNFQTLSKRVLGLFSLRELEEMLPPHRFMRIHKSYIVALDRVKEIDGNQVKVGTWTIPVSKTYRPKLLELFSKR